MSLKPVEQLDEGVRVVAKIHARKQPHVEANTWYSRVARTMILQWGIPIQPILSFKAFEVMQCTIRGLRVCQRRFSDGRLTDPMTSQSLWVKLCIDAHGLAMILGR